MYKINLLPSELQRDLSIDVKGLFRRVAVTVTVLLVLGAYGTFLLTGYLTQKEIAEKEMYLKQISSTVKKVEAIKAERVKNEENTKKYKELLEARHTWSPLLEDIRYNMPVDLWFKNLELSYVLPESDNQASQTGQQNGNGSKSNQPQGKTAAPTQAKEQPAAEKDGQVSLPVPNTLTIEGCATAVPSVGFFMNTLYRMPYFSHVFLNEVKLDEKTGSVKFKLTATLKGDER